MNPPNIYFSKRFNLSLSGVPEIGFVSGDLKNLLCESGNACLESFCLNERLAEYPESATGGLSYYVANDNCWRIVFRPGNSGPIRGAVHGQSNVLQNIFVDPEFRRYGIGRLLVSAARTWINGLIISGKLTKDGAKFFDVKK